MVITPQGRPISGKAFLAAATRLDASRHCCHGGIHDLQLGIARGLNTYGKGIRRVQVSSLFLEQPCQYQPSELSLALFVVKKIWAATGASPTASRCLPMLGIEVHCRPHAKAQSNGARQEDPVGLVGPGLWVLGAWLSCFVPEKEKLCQHHVSVASVFLLGVRLGDVGNSAPFRPSPTCILGR